MRSIPDKYTRLLPCFSTAQEAAAEAQLVRQPHCAATSAAVDSLLSVLRTPRDFVVLLLTLQITVATEDAVAFRELPQLATSAQGNVF